MKNGEKPYFHNGKFMLLWTMLPIIKLVLKHCRSRKRKEKASKHDEKNLLLFIVHVFAASYDSTSDLKSKARKRKLFIRIYKLKDEEVKKATKCVFTKKNLGYKNNIESLREYKK